MKKYPRLAYAILTCFVIVIMCISTTYAYWTATTSSAESDVKAQSTSYSINMEITPIPKYSGFSFIPMNDQDALKALKNECKDKYKRGACTAYNIRVFGYKENLDYISGYMDIITEDMQNLSFMVLEESEEVDEEKCAEVGEKNYCIGSQPTRMGEGSNLSLGPSYSVLGKTEKNLLLLIWLSNLNTNQNETDIGSFSAVVTIQAGNGGEIKGYISNAIQIEPPTPDVPNS